MSKNERKVGNHSVRVETPEMNNISAEDKDMDRRINAAVNSAINRAKVCQKPIAKYDRRKKKAYVIDSNGEKKYVS
ncbi:MAG: hypothetical protein IKE53_06025 [Clostridiales bacterium]|nr:hypothetical protein [Clostridiales bacterium]